MTQRAAIIGTGALPVGRYQTGQNAPIQVVEHELLARLIVDTVEESGAERERIGAVVVAQPRPYTRQQYFSTFLTAYLRLPCSGIVMEVLGNGLTAALAFDKAVDEILLGRAEVALAVGINMETAVRDRKVRRNIR